MNPHTNLVFDRATSLTTAGSRDNQLPASGLKTTTPAFLTPALDHLATQVTRGGHLTGLCGRSPGGATTSEQG